MERTNELDTQKIADIISPLVDRLEQLSSQAKLDNSNPNETKPFPTLQEYLDSGVNFGSNISEYSRISIYYYFSQFRYEKMPEVGKEYKGKSTFNGEWFKGKLIGFNIGHTVCDTIRPITTPTRESIIEKARQVLSEDELNILTGGNK